MVIESTVIEYLNNHTSIAHQAYGDTPRSGAFQYYLVQKTGSTNRNHLHTAQITIQSYGSSKSVAKTMNETLISAMAGIVELENISACRLNSDYDYTDTAKRRYRYQAVFDITYIRED